MKIITYILHRQQFTIVFCLPSASVTRDDRETLEPNKFHPVQALQQSTVKVGSGMFCSTLICLHPGRCSAVSTSLNLVVASGSTTPRCAEGEEAYGGQSRISRLSDALP
jgi:hypothetical protein